MQRRQFLRTAAATGVAISFGGGFLRHVAADTVGGAHPLVPVDLGDGGVLEIPSGFTSRVVARALHPVNGVGEVWPPFPDGAACYPRPDGGWTLVSNSEVPLPPSTGFVGTESGVGALPRTGGVGALDFGPDGQQLGVRRILDGTYVNCAGGITPWGSWLSCEEWDGGLVWEVWPDASQPPRALPALGSFAHEAAAVVAGDGGLSVFLTEDEGDGLLYRYDAPVGATNLEAAQDPTAGTLWALTVQGDPSAGSAAVGWVQVTGPRNPPAYDYQDDWLGRLPDGRSWYPAEPLRTSVAGTPFDGGEGCWHHAGHVYFATKGDDRVWDLDLAADSLSVLIDGGEDASDNDIEDVDNVIVDPTGTTVLIAQDHHELEIHAIDIASGASAQVVKMTGAGHSRHPLGPTAPSPLDTFERSEVTGLAFDPSGTRLYCSSQRYDGFGITYEIQGAWSELFTGVGAGA